MENTIVRGEKKICQPETRTETYEREKVVNYSLAIFALKNVTQILDSYFTVSVLYRVAQCFGILA